MTLIQMNCASITSGDALHETLRRLLFLPDCYGRNLDALYDCLTELPETLLFLSGTDAMQKALGPYADAFLQVLRDAAEENSGLKITVWS